MKIKFKALGIPIAGLKVEEEIQLPPGSKLEDLINIIGKNLDETNREILKEAIYMVNGSNAKINTGLRQGDQVRLLRLLGGG